MIDNLDELIYLARKGNSIAYKLLFGYYENTIRYIAKSKNYNQKMMDELFLKGTCVYNQILYSYDKGKKATFLTYMNICIYHRLSTIPRKKFQILFSLDEPFSYSDKRVYGEVIADQSAEYQPTKQMEAKQQWNSIQTVVDEFRMEEIVMFQLILHHLSVNEMALILNTSLKKIYNDKYRLLKKIRNNNSFDS